MKRLDKYTLGRILAPTLTALAAVTFVSAGIRISQYSREMPVELVTVGDVSRLSILLLPSLITIVFPMTLLLGIIMAFSRLAQRSEIVAMMAAGVPLKRVVAPVIALGAVVSGLSFAVQDVLQPWTIARAFDVIYSELPQRATIDMLAPGVMHQYGDVRVYFARKDPVTLTLHDLVLVRPEAKGGASVFQAASARLSAEGGRSELHLTDGRWLTPDLMSASFEETTLSIQRPPAIPVRGARKARSLAQLFATESGLATEYESSKSGRTKEELRKERSEIALRLAMPFASLAVSLAAAPLGARARRSGRSFMFAAGSAVFVAYYGLSVLMEPPVARSLTTHIVNAWVPNVALMLAGGVLMWRIDRI